MGDFPAHVKNEAEGFKELANGVATA